MPQSCVLFSDITGSTQLYETETNQVALAQIDKVLIRMREIVETGQGTCVKSQGDDVLSFFSHPETAFQVAWKMIHEEWPGKLSVHVGMYFGEILNHEADIYGRAVNTAARLSSLAKPGEILLGESCYHDLSEDSKQRLLMIGELALRGKSDPTRVYACSVQEISEQTVIFAGSQAERSDSTEFAEFFYHDRRWQITEGETLTIGRSAECDIVLEPAWVSRSHAAVSLRRGQLEFTDHSSTGSVLLMAGGKEMNVHRRATLLSGEGVIHIGAGSHADASSTLSFITHTLRIRTAAQ